MLYKDIYQIINSYLYNIEIIDDKRIKYRCSQCRKFFYYFLLKETNEQSWPGSPRIYCKACRVFFKLDFTYKEFK